MASAPEPPGVGAGDGGPGTAARRRHAVLAGHRGNEAASRAALDDPDPGVRAAALGALHRLDRLTPADIERGAGDPAPEVRRRAAEVAPALATLLGPAHPTADVLGRLLADDDASVVEVAAFASGERQPPEEGAVDALRTVATDHEDPLCRETAVAALGAIGDDAGLPAVLAALDDRPAVRRRAVIALAAFDGTEVDDALRRSLDDRDRQVRQAAEDLLGR